MKALFLALNMLLVSVGAFASDLIAVSAQEIDVLGEGEFRPSDNRHFAEGGVQIERRQDGLYIKLNQDFKVSQGPDLRVTLRDSRGMSSQLVVDHLKSFSGTQEYKLSISEEALRKYDLVVIYCLEFHVDFGYAQIRK